MTWRGTTRQTRHDMTRCNMTSEGTRNDEPSCCQRLVNTALNGCGRRTNMTRTRHNNYATRGELRGATLCCGVLRYTGCATLRQATLRNATLLGLSLVTVPAGVGWSSEGCRRSFWGYHSRTGAIAGSDARHGICTNASTLRSVELCC